MASWSPRSEIVDAFVGLLLSTVDPFAEHSAIYNRLERLREQLGDFELYLCYLLCQWNTLRGEVCQAAGLLLKQSIKGKYASGSQQKMPEDVKTLVRGALVELFLQVDATSGAYKSKAIQNTLGTVMSTIVGFEGLYAWPELMSKMLSPLCTEEPQVNVVQLQQLEETLDLLFKVLEEHGENDSISQDIAKLCSQVNLGNVLVRTASNQKTSIRVKALKCLYHILRILYLSEGISMDKEVLKQQQLTQNLLKQLLVLTNDPEPEVKASVCTGFVEVLEVDAKLLQPHLEGLVRYMLVMSQDQDSLVALEATGFWSVYMETIDYYSMADGDSFSQDCEYWLQMVLGDLIKVLTRNMKYEPDDEELIAAEAIWEDIKLNRTDFQQQLAFQENTNIKPFQLKTATKEEEEEGDVVESWTLRRSSAGTLDHLAEHFGDNLLPLLLPIVTASLASTTDWFDRESAILALGAVIPGCPGLEQHTLEVVKILLPQLHSVEAQHPLLISICCWTLSRFARPVVNISSESGEVGRDLYGQMHKSLLLQMHSKHPKVLEAACSALATCIQDLPTPFLLQILDSTIEVILQGTGTFTGKNLILLYDLIVTLCEAINASEVPHLLRDAKYLNSILMPLLDKLFNTKRFDEVLFLNLVQSLSVIVLSFGEMILPFTEKIFQFCNQVLYMQLQMKDQGMKMKYDDKCIVVILGLMTGVIDALGSNFPHQLVTMEFLGILCGWLSDDSSDVKQAAFSFVGSLLRACPQHVEHIASKVIECGLACLDIKDPNDLDEVSSANNACWCISQIVVTFPRSLHGEMCLRCVQLAEPFLQRSSGYPRILLENACVLIGCIGMFHAQTLAPYLDQFFWGWAVALGSLCDSLEKERAFFGMVRMLQLRREVGFTFFVQVANAVASWHKINSIELKEILRELLQEFVQRGVTLEKIPHATRQKLFHTNFLAS